MSPTFRPMVSPGQKAVVLGLLAICYVVQTALVYRDDPSEVLLDGASLAGAELWHDHNCQACHQLYGFGGFLGPDLTNIATRVGDVGLEAHLEGMFRGQGQMPAFEISEEERGQLAAFLKAMDATGVGEAHVVTSASFSDRIERLLPRGSEAHAAGWKLAQERACLACHVPFEKGPTGAPAFTSVGGFEATRVDTALQNGKAPLMPPPSPALTETERQQLLSFLQWLNAQRDALQPVENAAEWTMASLPWWEYP